METAHNYQPSSPHSHTSQFQQLQPFYPADLQEPDDDELDLEQIWTIVRRRAVLIAGITTVVAAAALAWTLNQTPKYQGTFHLLVEPVVSDKAQLSGVSSALQTIGMGSVLPPSGLDYESQVEVLQSPKQMAPIIVQLQSRYPKIDYRSLFGGMGQKGSLSIERLKKTKVLEVNYLDSDPEKIQFVLEQLAQGYLRYSLEDRKSDSRQGIQFIEDQLPQLRQRVDTLQQQLQQFRQQYNLIDPQVQGEQLAEQITTLQEDSLETQTSLAQQQLLFANLQQRLGLDPESALKASALTQSPRYQQLLNQLRDIETKIATEKARFTDNSPSIQALRDQQQNLLPLIRQEAQEVLGENISQSNTEVLRAPFQDSIRLGLASQLIDTANKIELLKVRNQAIGEAQGFFNQQVQQFPVMIRQYTDLQRELGVATATLNQLLGQREMLRVEAAKQDVPWELISEPKLVRNKKGKLIPAEPSVSKTFGIGVIGGLLLGLGAALLAERLNNVFHTPQELKDTTRLALLGVIPYSDQAMEVPRSRVLADSATKADFYYAGASPLIEAFRSLNANLRLLNSGNPIRSVVISSAAPADGKSTVAVNLAQAAAAMGQRVLLVDTDLRWPQVSSKMGLKNTPGLTEAITTNAAPADVMQQSPTEENLFVLTAGSIPPDPLRLLSSKKMQSFMEQWQAAFDLIIYDAPPLLGLADASLLAGHTDGILLVVGIGQTERSEVTQALDGLHTSGTPVLGVVANKASGYPMNAYYDHRRYPTAYQDQRSADPDAVAL